MAITKNTHSEADERADIRGDGRIILYKRPVLKNPKWQVRLRVLEATEYKTISTRSAKLSTAEAFANNLYDDFYLHIQGGGSVRSKTFGNYIPDKAAEFRHNMAYDQPHRSTLSKLNQRPRTPRSYSLAARSCLPSLRVNERYPLARLQTSRWRYPVQ